MALSKFTVCDLLNIDDFPNLPIEEKLAIKEKGRPTPDLKIVKVTECRNRSFKREFNRNVYKRHSWICGCEQSNKFYCYPCLLFHRKCGDLSFVKHGVADLSHLPNFVRRHEKLYSHIDAEIEYTLLSKIDTNQQLKSAYLENKKQQNDQIKENLHVLSKIIDCIIFCGAFDTVLTDRDEHGDSFKHCEVFKGLINLSLEVDESLNAHLAETSVFKKDTSKEIVNELLDCMLAVYQNEIRQEIKNASFLSLIAEEFSDSSSIFQLAVVFRYVLPDGQPVERFWQFDTPAVGEALVIAEALRSTVDSVAGDPDKLISQTFNGSSVMSGPCATLIKHHYKNVVFIHGYAHTIHSVVTQAASENQQVRVFFSELSEITNFFSNSPKRVAVLDEIVRRRVPTAAPATSWNFKSQIVTTVHLHRGNLIRCLVEIQSSSKHEATLIKSANIKRMLEDASFVFWLAVFHKIMSHVNTLHNQLQPTCTDADRAQKCVDHFLKKIQSERNNMYLLETHYFSGVNNENFKSKKPRGSGLQENLKPTARTVAANQVCDVIATQMRSRFSYLTHFSAVSLFCADKFNDFAKVFPTDLVSQTISDYPYLEEKKLITELEVIYKRQNFRQTSGAVALLKFIKENNLETTFTETYKLLVLIATIPMASQEAERCFSTLQKIRNFLRNTQREDRLTALAILSIEKDVVRNIKNFKGKVMDMFVNNKDRRKDFLL